MITKRISGRKDGKSSCASALGYGEGMTPDRETGELLDKSHRTRLGNFGLVDDGVYAGRDAAEMSELIELASTEMQSNCDLNTRVGSGKKLAHFVISYNQDMPSEAVLRDTEDSMLSAMKLDKNHFATFLHNDNGYWHLHIFASRIEKEKPHRGNPLWRDKTLRDKVCREIEIRHGLLHDNGLHEIKDGQIVEVPLAERIARRDAKPLSITDKARTTEIYSGEKSFQTWCNEIRIGDRLKHAKSWQDIHTAAAAYGCEVRQKGAGFVICPTGEKGGIQLSKVGLKNLPARYGAFEASKPGHQVQKSPETTYKPSPTIQKAASHYDRWREAKNAFKPIHTAQINEQREAHKKLRAGLRAQQKTDLEKIRSSTKGDARFVAVSVAKMSQVVAQAALTEQLALERQALRRQLSNQGPGNSFRDYLVIEAGKGDNIALGLARKYGVDEATDVLRKREADRLKIVAAVAGQEYLPALRLPFTHHIERSGAVVFDLGMGRTITDSSVSKQLQLNAAAASSPEAIATALRFATSKFGPTLTLTGTAEFQRLAVETAVRKGLNINFKDPAMEAYKQELTASLKKEKTNVTRTRPHQTRRIPPAHRRDRLHQLSEFTLAGEPNQPQMLLQKNVPYSVAERDEQGRNGAGLRRPDAGSGRATGADLSGTSPGTNLGVHARHGVGVRAVSQTRHTSEASQRSHLPVADTSSSAPSNLSRVAGKAKRAAAPAAVVPAAVPLTIVPVDVVPLSAMDWAKSESLKLGDSLKNCDVKVEYIEGGEAVLRCGFSKPFIFQIPNGIELEKGQLIFINNDGALIFSDKSKGKNTGKGR